MLQAPTTRWPVARLAVLATAALLAACAAPPPPVVAEVKPPPLEQPVPASALKLLAERFPDLHLVSNSTGPLRQPEASEVAVVLSRNDAPGEFTVALLEPGSHDDFRVAAVSHPIVPGCQECSVSADLARRGLYVHVIRADGADFENFSYQFAYADGAQADDALRLVGVTAYIPSRPADPTSQSFSASVDLLTGKRTDIVEEAQNDDTLHREQQTTVPVRPPIAFDAFTFNADSLEAETSKRPPVVLDPAGTLPAAAADALRERFPQMTVQSQSSGTLRGDGRDIVAVLVPADRSARPGAAADAVVAVLLAQPDGGVKLADVSGAMPHACTTCDVQVQIARRVLSVQTTDVGAAGSVAVDYQFAFRPKESPLRLVGVRTETTLRSAGSGDRHSVASTNLVSGDRVDVVDTVVDGRKARSTQKSKLPVRPPILLSMFTFDAAALGDDIAPEPAVSAAGARLSGS